MLCGLGSCGVLGAVCVWYREVRAEQKEAEDDTEKGLGQSRRVGAGGGTAAPCCPSTCLLALHASASIVASKWMKHRAGCLSVLPQALPTMSLTAPCPGLLCESGSTLCWLHVHQQWLCPWRQGLLGMEASGPVIPIYRGFGHPGKEGLGNMPK